MGHERPAPLSLPFIPDLHDEFMRSWDKPFSTHSHSYAGMPLVEDALVSYLVPDDI